MTPGQAGGAHSAQVSRFAACVAGNASRRPHRARRDANGPPPVPGSQHAAIPGPACMGVYGGVRTGSGVQNGPCTRSGQWACRTRTGGSIAGLFFALRGYGPIMGCFSLSFNV